MENQIYNWLVKKGNIQIQKKKTCISLQLDYENGECCLLTRSDAYEIIQILTKIAKQIWEDPNYERKPYTSQLYKKTDNQYYWETDKSELIIKFNEIEDAIEISSKGNKTLLFEINHIVEIIQILEHLNR